ncbi:MAG TPA: hypothetical protein VGP77_10945, partial [Vicinamibacterales bacterium]|nr:hypothetical protein [Vicinamibacterales bacterium]
MPKTLKGYKLQLASTTGTPPRGIMWGGAFPTAIHGLVNGVKCRAICPGDLPGASTVLLVSDPTGAFYEVKREDFICTDGAYL